MPAKLRHRDNYDIIDWISKQSWCNGKDGMVGGSYAGQMQWQATIKLHPAKNSCAVGSCLQRCRCSFCKWCLSNFRSFVTHMFRTDQYNNTHGNDEHWDNIYSTYLTKGIAFNRLDSLVHQVKKMKYSSDGYHILFMMITGIKCLLINNNILKLISRF